MKWNWNYVIEIFPVLLKVLPLVIGITCLSFLVALIAGLFLALMKRSRSMMISLPAKWIAEFIRSTPLIVQLLVLFYALPLYGVSLSPFAAGVIGLGLHYSSYLSEVYRSGIDAVDRGQWEAATALNFTDRQKWLHIILPQAVPPTLPVMGNYLIVMFKETPVLSAITFIELLTTAKTLGSASFRYIEAFTIVGLLFLFLSYFSSLIVKRLEQKFQRK
ncbi:ectoine/hydroxyectoine ABC transporter permease subunit EhuD [Paenibacillus agricola]|uniref:Ectoine/hydroxyectoine ABC transporter permease subunit EhuD n=1 Tax=Paenibacillus agricola TaxID=2716264 RepID=A0ABX0JCF4_9BACL|nr:ectoine/hydroxyectoine ABC transporter permease subunit EhuD [Paenibacillus agricola]NHN33243.1 ectoine/hydroxyectoine ABC transporter permease subunit EhuD [Paenibacillus agricola]